MGKADKHPFNPFSTLSAVRIPFFPLLLLLFLGARVCYDL